jgi:hypothetical protein
LVEPGEESPQSLIGRSQWTVRVGIDRRS